MNAKSKFVSRSRLQDVVENQYPAGAAQASVILDQRIIPIFGPQNFPTHIDYHGAFEKAALLASRLLKSQQACHFLYAVWFGKNRTSTVPSSHANKSPPKVPQEYATNRGVGELTPHGISVIDEHLETLSRSVRFNVAEIDNTRMGQTELIKETDEQGQSRDTIVIETSQSFYNIMIQEHSPAETAVLHFSMSSLLVHELAHAATIFVMGDRAEDFFENSIFAAAGSMLQTAIFGMTCMEVPHNPLRTHWANWQTTELVKPASYAPDRHCRCVARLPEQSDFALLDPAFAERLLDDTWWEEKEDRSADLIPDFLTNHIENMDLFLEMPECLQEWILGRDGESYASQKYAFAEHPTLELRTVAPHDGTPLEVDTPLPSPIQADEQPSAKPEPSTIVQPEPAPEPTAWIPLPVPSIDDIRVVIEDGITTISEIHSIFAPRLRHTDPTHEACRIVGFLSRLRQVCKLEEATGTLFLN